MKNMRSKIVASLLVILVLGISSGCQSAFFLNTKAKIAPPGQVKKVTGSKSAKQYAPGQLKK